MTSATSSSIDAISRLRQQVQSQQHEIDHLNRLMERKEVQWEATKAALFEPFRLAIERRFGPSTEKYRVEQADLLINEAEAAVDEEGADEADEDAASSIDDETAAGSAGDANDTPLKRRTRGGRIALPPELPRVEVVHDLPDDEKLCPDDGTALKRIGENISEALHVVPARVEVIRHIRPKYACPVCENGVSIAPASPKLLPKSNASATLLAYVATAKYQDALPLHRQSGIFARHGIDIPRNTLARWMVQAGERLLPLIETLPMLDDDDDLQSLLPWQWKATLPV